MKYYSTNKQVPEVSFEDAIFKGLPEDNGLYMPKTIQKLPQEFFDNIQNMTLSEIGYEVASRFIEEDEIPAEDLRQLVADTLNFDIPLMEVEKGIYSMELYHGPTLAFKDVGARFLARCLSYFSKQSSKKATILVATSGDTGGAVASGFLGMKNINVVILYPKGKISKIQEQQLTTHGQNITACEIDGTFDDCQRMVKEAFLDADLKKKFNLTSANSINMARLVPQSFYYFWAYAKLKNQGDLVVSVPSGNYGNLSAGLLAKRMGLHIKQFVASTNANDIVPIYLKTGNFAPKPSVETISNAMDVGNPSNFYRMNDLFANDLEAFKEEIIGFSYSDDETSNVLKKVYQDRQYLMDPHGAVGYLGLKDYLSTNDGIGVFLETAHPAKFLDIVEPIINEDVEIPHRLKEYIEKEKVAIEISSQMKDLIPVFEKVCN